MVARALETIATGRGQMLEFGVADETAFRAGLSCGGRIRIDLRPLDSGLLEALNVERAARRPCATVTGLGSGAQRLVRAAEFAADPFAKQLGARLRRRVSGVEEADGCAFFLNLYPPPPRLIAIGAVHIAQALAPIATLAGFETIIVDPRTGFASEARFPGARVVAEWPATALQALGLDFAVAVALLTHDPRIDDEALIAALRARCFYVGALGSRKTHAKRVERMRAEGFGEMELGRIHAPIGLDIGATSPAEIAVAILAEIINSLHRRDDLGMRRMRFGPVPVRQAEGDPGNLLLLGALPGDRQRPVIGAPGCARSPKENGFDFVLNRLRRPLEGQAAVFRPINTHYNNVLSIVRSLVKASCHLRRASGRRHGRLRVLPYGLENGETFAMQPKSPIRVLIAAVHLHCVGGAKTEKFLRRRMEARRSPPTQVTDEFPQRIHGDAPGWLNSASVLGDEHGARGGENKCLG